MQNQNNSRLWLLSVGEASGQDAENAIIFSERKAAFSWLEKYIEKCNNWNSKEIDRLQVDEGLSLEHAIRLTMWQMGLNARLFEKTINPSPGHSSNLKVEEFGREETGGDNIVLITQMLACKLQNYDDFVLDEIVNSSVPITPDADRINNAGFVAQCTTIIEAHGLEEGRRLIYDAMRAG